MNLLCYLLGHDYDPEGECHGYYDCTRCGASGYAPQETPGARVRGVDRVAQVADQVDDRVADQVVVVATRPLQRLRRLVWEAWR